MSDLAKSLGKAVQRTSKPKEQKQGTTETQKPDASAPVAKRGRGGHIQVVNPHTKRLTVDVTPEQDRFLALFGVNHGLKKNPVLRVLIDLLEKDETVKEKVLKSCGVVPHE